MKVVVRLVDSKNRVLIDGRTVMPNIDNTLKKTETVVTAIRQGVLKFVRNIDVPKEAPTEQAKETEIEATETPPKKQPKKGRRKKKVTTNNSNQLN